MERLFVAKIGDGMLPELMRIFGLVGWSGSGKTTLITGLVEDLVRRGISVSTMKRAHQEFDLDRTGKDSYLHRAAGAMEVMVTSTKRWALMHELQGRAELSIEEAAQRMTKVDLLLIEGSTDHPLNKLEVHRPSIGKSLMAPSDPFIVAVASDEPLSGVTVPVLDLNDHTSIANFVTLHCELTSHSDSAA